MKRLKNIACLFLVLIAFTFSTSCISLSTSQDVNAINGITQNKIITATFSVNVYKRTLMGYNKVAQGSAVIFQKEETQNGEFTYYLLTNNHVVSEGNYYMLEDCYGNEVNAVLYKNDANYDLAILTFTMPNDYSSLTFSSGDAIINQKVIAIGRPNGQINAVTLGKVKNYLYVEVDNAKKEESNVKFKVLEHTAPIDTGSSGGVVLNYSYQIVGINFACVLEGDVFSSSYAVQTSKILEFINS